jgi:hypothetical protein
MSIAVITAYYRPKFFSQLVPIARACAETVPAALHKTGGLVFAPGSIRFDPQPINPAYGNIPDVYLEVKIPIVEMPQDTLTYRGEHIYEVLEEMFPEIRFEISILPVIAGWVSALPDRQSDIDMSMPAAKARVIRTAPKRS